MAMIVPGLRPIVVYGVGERVRGAIIFAEVLLPIVAHE